MQSTGSGARKCGPAEREKNRFPLRSGGFYCAAGEIHWFKVVKRKLVYGKSLDKKPRLFMNLFFRCAIASQYKHVAMS